MSSILLKKDHKEHKAGTVISVPFMVGKVLVKDGTGEYFDAEKHPWPDEESIAEAGKKAQALKGGPKGGESKAGEGEPPMKPNFPPEPQPQPLGTTAAPT